jgi:hypothetical protein
VVAKGTCIHGKGLGRSCEDCQRMAVQSLAASEAWLGVGGYLPDKDARTHCCQAEVIFYDWYRCGTCGEWCNEDGSDDGHQREDSAPSMDGQGEGVTLW